MSDPLDLDAIEARADAAMAGPWFWSGSMNSMGPGPYLASWNRGSGLGKCMVMGSKRLGMRGAQPTFYADGLMVPAVKIAEREVDYRDDIVDIRNPNAEFIAHAREDVPALVAELRTARARITDLEIRYGDTERHWLKERTERRALAARIERAAAIQRKYPGGESDPVMLQRAVGWNECLDAFRAALSGATEPAADSEPTCPLHGLPLGPAPAKNCPECRRQIAHTLGEETR